MRISGWVWRAFFLLVVGALLVVGFLLARFESWRMDRLVQLADGASLVETAAGPQQYAERGEGVPVLIVHGAPGGYDQGLAIAAGLGLEEGFRVISPSRPGYLDTPIGARLLPEQQADDLAALLETLEVERAMVVGFSAGGPAAVQLAVRHPSLVSGVVLASACVAPLPRPTERQPLPEAVLRSLSGDIGAALAGWAAEKAPSRVVEATVPMIYAGTAGQRKALETAVLASEEELSELTAMVESVMPLSPREQGTRNDLLQLSVLPELPPVPQDVPLLAVHGTQDAFVPVAEARAYSARVPGSLFVAVEDGSHLFWIGPDGPRASSAIREFLSREAVSTE